MKRLMLILFVAFLGLAVNAQLSPTEVTPDGYIRGASYKYLFSTTADTLTDADTLTSVIRIKGNTSQDFNIKLYTDWVSGTAGGTLIVSHSIDGVNYVSVAGDTITYSAITADAMDAEVINKENFLWPYMKFYLLQSGTAVTLPKVWIYTKPD